MKINKKFLKIILYIGIFLVWAINFILIWKVTTSVLIPQITGFNTFEPPQEPTCFGENTPLEGPYKVFKPNISFLFNGCFVKLKPSKISTNSYGLRDEDRSIEKPKDTIRVLALGDSVTFGWGLNIEDTWVKQLEDLLNKNEDSDIKYEVMNFGIPGYNAQDELELLKNVGIRFNPDIILLTYAEDDWKYGDLSIAHQNYFEGLRNKTCNYNEDCRVTHEQIYLMAREAGAYILEKFSNQAFKNIEEPYEEINRISKEKNIGIIFGSHLLGKKEFSDSIYKLAKDFNWKTVDFASKFPKSKAQKYFFHNADRHPNYLASGIIAESYYHQIKNYKIE